MQLCDSQVFGKKGVELRYVRTRYVRQPSWLPNPRPSRRLSFAACGEAVVAVAASHSHISVSPCDELLLSKGVLEYHTCVVSAQWRQATPVVLKWRQSFDKLVGMLRDTTVAALLVGAPKHALAQEIFEQEVETFKKFSGINGAPPQLKRWSWAHKPCALLAARGGDKSNKATVLFTLGSTNRPKDITHTNATLLWIAEHFAFPTPKMVKTLCFMHKFRVLCADTIFLLPFACGVGCSVHGGDATDAITAQLLLNAAAALKPTIFDTVPFIMANWSSMSAAELAPLAGASPFGRVVRRSSRRSATVSSRLASSFRRTTVKPRRRVCSC